MSIKSIANSAANTVWNTVTDADKMSTLPFIQQAICVGGVTTNIFKCVGDVACLGANYLVKEIDSLIQRSKRLTDLPLNMDDVEESYIRDFKGDLPTETNNTALKKMEESREEKITKNVNDLVHHIKYVGIDLLRGIPLVGTIFSIIRLEQRPPTIADINTASYTAQATMHQELSDSLDNDGIVPIHMTAISAKPQMDPITTTEADETPNKKSWVHIVKYDSEWETIQNDRAARDAVSMLANRDETSSTPYETRYLESLNDKQKLIREDLEERAAKLAARQLAYIDGNMEQTNEEQELFQ